MKAKRSLLIGLIIFFGLWLAVKLYRFIPTYRAQQAAVAEVEQQLPEQLREGVVTIDAVKWKGVQCLENDMRITWKILTPGVYWKVAFDKDYTDSKVYHCYPKGYVTNSMLVITNTYNLVEWMIEPGQTITQAQVAWQITPDTGWPPK